jgi:hypothetical protein
VWYNKIQFLDMRRFASFSYNIIWNNRLNHWLMDYDIIRILRNHMGYKSWSDVPMNQRELCYKGYTKNNKLPPWDIQQESYWPSDSVNVHQKNPIKNCWCLSNYSNQELFDSFWLHGFEGKSWTGVRVRIICFVKNDFEINVSGHWFQLAFD